MIEHSQDIKELIKALAIVQSKVSGVEKDSTNPHFRNRYASLEAVISTVREPLGDAGIVFTQAPGAMIGNAVEITTMLMHTSGQWLRSTLHVPLDKATPQGVGSAITYGCRYALMGILGLPAIDDDAESATTRAPAKAAQHFKPPGPSGQFSVQDIAREAARHGRAAVRAFFDSRSVAEKAQINAIKPELELLIEEAEANAEKL